MAKRKKRSAITLVSLLLALTALILAYVWYVNRVIPEDTPEVQQTIDLAAMDQSQITSLHYIREDADLTLVLQDGVWVSEEEPGRPIRQDYVEKILSTFDEVKADRLIAEVPEKLADYGLEPYAAYLQAIGADGTTLTVRIGDAAGNGEGYYGMVDEDPKVYLLPIEYGSALQYSNVEMTAVEEGPEITAENIHHIDVINRDGEDYELMYLPDAGPDISGTTLYSWRIMKPYGEGYSADDSMLSDIQSNYTGFDFIQCVDYQGDDLSLYGLQDPAASIYVGYYVARTETLEEPEVDPDTGEETTEKTYYDPMEYKLYVGNLNEDEQYYVRAEGSKAVYTMSKSTVEKMLTIDTFSIMNHAVCIPNINSVDQIDVNINDITYTMNLERTTVKDEEGKEETQTTYFFNDKEEEKESFADLYRVMISALYDAEIKEEIATEGVDPYMTMSFRLNDEEETTVWASFLPYNDSFYIVKTADGARFFADKRKVEEIAEAVATH